MKTETPSSPAAAPATALSSPAPALAVVEAPDPLAELNETKRALAHSERLLVKAGDELQKLANYIQRIEKNPLVMALSNLDEGSVLDEAGDLLSQVTASVRKQQANGSFTLSFKIEPFKGHALLFKPDMKIKEPHPAMAKGVFYADDHGQLSREDPRQRELKLGSTSRPDRSPADDPDAYRDEREAGGQDEDSAEDLARAQRLIDEAETFPRVADLQKKLQWGYTKASRVLSRLAKG